MLTKVECVWIEAIRVIGVMLYLKPLSSQPSGSGRSWQIWFLPRVDFLLGDLQGHPCNLPLEGIPFSISCLSTHICLYNYMCIYTGIFLKFETILIIHRWKSSGLCKSIMKYICPVGKELLMALHTNFILRCLCIGKNFLKFLRFWKKMYDHLWQSYVVWVPIASVFERKWTFHLKASLCYVAKSWKY